MKYSDLPGEPETAFPASYGRDSEEIFQDSLVTDLTGKPIIFPESVGYWSVFSCAEAMSEIIGRQFAPVKFRTSEEKRGLGLKYAKCHSVCMFPPHPTIPLTLIQRAQATAIAQYYQTHRTGIKISEPIVLPKILQDAKDMDCAGETPIAFRDEAKAFQLADVVERLFFQKCSVVDSANGWMVCLEPEDSDSMGAEDLAKLIGICRLICEYDLSPVEEYQSTCEAQEAPEKREEWNQRRHAPMNAMMQKIDELLICLTRIETKLRLADPVGV